MTAQTDLLIKQIVSWGRAQEKRDTVAVDVNNHFGRKQVEAFRRWLRDQYNKRNRAVFGSWRKGYELDLGDEYVGVGNGYGSFKIYYRCRKEQDPITTQVFPNLVRIDTGDFIAEMSRTGEVTYNDSDENEKYQEWYQHTVRKLRGR